MLKTILVCLLATSALFAQISARSSALGNAAPEPQGSPTSGSNSAAVQAINDLLSQIQASAQRTDADIARLRIDKWKAESSAKQQAQASALSIRRNLTNAIPDLVQRIQAAPASMNANFRLYRNLNALYDTFSSLTESAGAFGPRDQYDSLATDIAQLDELRHKVAERVDQLAGFNDAELARLRAKAAGNSSAAKPAKVVVDDEQPKPKKKAKAAQSSSQTPK